MPSCGVWCPSRSCIVSKRLKTRPWLLRNANRKPYPSFRLVPFSMTLNNLYPDFKVMSLFDAEYFRYGMRQRHDYNGIRIGTYTCHTHVCHFEWSWVTLSDLAKYSVIRSIARPLCSIRVSCVYDVDTQGLDAPTERPPSIICRVRRLQFRGRDVLSSKATSIGNVRVKWY